MGIELVMSAPARGTPEVRIVSYAATNNQQECDSLFANYTKPNAKGLVIHECSCGSHIWAVPWCSEMENWLRHQRSPLRTLCEEKGFKPKEPTLSGHIVIASHEDEPLLKMRRWKVYAAKKGHRVRYHLKAGRRGFPLQRLVFPTAEAITFDNANGLDVRRENIRRTTIRKLLKERDARRRRARKAAQVAEKAALQVAA